MTKPSRIYAVSANVTRHNRGWESTQQVPTFYLFADVQGIVSEDHALRIARSMFENLGHAPEDVSVSVCETSCVAH